MSPDDAKAYGVSDGDQVAVALAGGQRDLVFGDVLIRVHPSFRLEMHLDTDEANAAELRPKSEGCLIHLDGAAGTLVAKRPTQRLRLIKGWARASRDNDREDSDPVTK
jgi:acetate kinase